MIIHDCIQTSFSDVHDLLYKLWETDTDDWVLISEKFYDEMLCVLPPIWGRGVWGVSEPTTHTSDGYIVTEWFHNTRQGLHYAQMNTKVGAQVSVLNLSDQLTRESRAV